MATLADSLVSSSARVLPMRMRPDLSAQPQRYQGRAYWVVKDPVGLHYYRFQEEEYAILKMLDGRSSLDQIKARFEKEFPPQKITVEELGQFVGMLHRSSLVIADVPGQGLQLNRRRKKRRKQEMLGMVSNILAIRFKGIDPNRILNWLEPKVRFMFTPTAVFFCGMLALSALTLVLVQFDAFRSKLPSFHQFFQANNWIYLGITLGLTKVIHEFGHGTTCKHFGGECHEMGVMVLVLTPCLYCNVSDSWMLPNKWHRAYIGAAGMYIEICIASICTFIWWFSNPGLLNQICLSTMFVCSVSTVMFNANPLLRYDGYYILSDLSEIPNLRQKASSILSRKLGSWCLGLEEPDDPFLPERNQAFFAIYSIAAAIYRWVVLFSILWFLYRVFEPYNLKILSQMIALVSIGGLIVQPLWKLGKFFYIPGRLEKVKKKNLRWTLGAVAAVALFVFVVPLPYRVICTLEIQPHNAEKVYVNVPGKLIDIVVEPGQHVEVNQTLAQLDSNELRQKISELEGRLDQAKLHLENVRRASFVDHREAQKIPQSEESVATYSEQLSERIGDLKRLTLKAPIAGVVMPTPERAKRDSEGQLPAWTGTPLLKRNLGATLTDSDVLCQIGNPQKFEAILVVDQDDIEFIREQQAVAIKLDELPSWTFHSKIDEIADNELKVAPRSLSNKTGGDVITKTDQQGMERPQNTSYQARAVLPDEPDNLLFIGMRGHAKIHAKWQTLGKRGWRYLAHTFNFKL